MRRSLPSAGPPARVAFCLAAIMIFAAALRLGLGAPMSDYDEFGYAHLAADAASGRFHFPGPGEPGFEKADPWIWITVGHWAARPLVWGPMALILKLFPFSTAAAAWPFLCSLGIVWIAWRFGREVGGDRAGLWAAALAGVFPLYVNYSTRVMAESVEWFFCGLSALLFYRFIYSDDPAPRGTGFLAGIAAGLCMQARVLGGSVWLAFLCWAVLRRRVSRLVWPALGTACILAAAAVFYKIATGDWLYDYRIAASLSGFWRQFEQPDKFWVYPASVLGLNLHGLASFGLFYFALIAAVVHLAWKRSLGPTHPFLVWISAVFLFFQFCPQEVFPYRMAVRQLRYLGLLNLPIVLVVALASASARRVHAWGLFVLLAATSVYAAHRTRLFRLEYMRPYRAVARAIQALPPGPLAVWPWHWELHLDGLLPGGFDFPLGLPPDRKTGRPVRLLEEFSNPRELRGMRILLNHGEKQAPERLLPLIRWVRKNGKPLAPIGSIGVLWELK